MTKENRGERERAGRIDRGQSQGMPRRGATGTYEDKMRRMLLVVTGMVLEPSVPIPPSLVAQAQATFLALVNAEFGDELNVSRETGSTLEEDDTWPDSDDVDF